MKKIKMKLLLSAVIGLSVTATGIANADILPLPGASQINPAMSSGFEQQLQGAWASTQGGHNVIVIFMNNMMGITYDNMTAYGTFMISGNQLIFRAQTGETQSWNFTVQGNQLNLDGMILQRQQINAPGPNTVPGPNPGPNTVPNPNTTTVPNPNTTPGNGGGAPSGGIWGPAPNPGPNPGSNGGIWGPAPNNGHLTPPTPNPGPAAGSVIDGVWGAQSPNGLMQYAFRGGQYSFGINGQVMETGTYSYNPQTGECQFRILTGQAAGQSGSNRIYVQGNQLIMEFPNGAKNVLTRQQ
ncbi:MAG: hypothetical protein IJ078_06630 [Succinivibrionaceae bacterium]|jgi:hypothetical protein|nr:hypothetical protein [Succinivibrionaceae bacterium]